MAENLFTTKFIDGSNIPLVSDASIWKDLNTPAYCWNNNDISYKNPYGALYNWYTVNTANLCPSGWHVPSDAEWSTLADYLGGDDIAGGKLKETGITHWIHPNTGANNESGFSALPGSSRHNADGNFHNDIGYSGYWWSSTRFSNTIAWTRSIFYNEYRLNRVKDHMKSGFSVHCVKD